MDARPRGLKIARIPGEPDGGTVFRHLPFPFAFVGAALLIALSGGFGVGAYAAAAIGLGWPLGDGFTALVQIHGHLQLVGWLGLFIMGVSLFFIPRFSSVPIRGPDRVPLLLLPLVAGMGLRATAQWALASGFTAPVSRFCLAAGGILELLGVGWYLAVLGRTVRNVKRSAVHPTPLEAVQPFFLLMLLGWLLYALIQTGLALAGAAGGVGILDAGWNDTGIRVFLLFVLLPVAFAFSLRTFPIFLGTPAPAWPVRALAAIYAAAVLAEIGPGVLEALGLEVQAAGTIADCGILLRAAAIGFLVVKVGVLTPSFLTRDHPVALHPRARHPFRWTCLHDFGEFGRFELLIYSAYAWLLAGVALEAASALGRRLGSGLVIPGDPIRHAFLLGFATLLILGMAARMIPGFLGRTLWSRRLVTSTFWLGNAAAAGRVLPLLVPEAWAEALPPVALAQRLGFACSGVLGTAAVGCLGVNLWRSRAVSRPLPK